METHRTYFFSIKKQHIFSLLFIVSSLWVNAQTISVFSKEDNQPIPAAHVFVRDVKSNTEKLFLTDTAGKVLISSFTNPNSTFEVKISYIGYQKMLFSLDKLSDRTIYLIPEKTILNEVVVTAQYAPNSPEKAVHKIKIIDSKKIEAMGAVNLRDVLTNELNIRLSQDNILGSSMSLQGVSGQNVKILIDGVPVTGRLNGNIDLSQINMNNVERIEVIEGPLSVNYGTDALGGTINIITKKTQKETFSFSSNNYYESIGQYNFNGKIGYKKNKDIITLSGGRNYFDGWRKIDKPFHVEQVRPADSMRYMNWKPKEQYFGNLFYGHYFKKLKLSYSGDYFYEQVTNRGKPRLPYNETAFDDYYTTNRITNSINLNGALNKKYYLNVLAAYNYFKRTKNTYFKDLTTLDQILTESASDQDTSIFKNIMTRGSISRTKDSAKINFEIGYDVNHETTVGHQILNKQKEIGDYAIFSSAEYKPISSLVIRPGLRAIYNTAYKAPLVPSLNIKYSFNIPEIKNKTAALRFSYARGFRAPTLKELYFYFVDINHNIRGNDKLKAEQSHNFNLSMSYNASYNDRASKLEMSCFYNYIENMISLAQSSGTQYSYFNIDNFQTMGVQLLTEYAIKHLKVSVGGAYIGRYNQLSQQYSADEFSYSPEGRCNVLYDWKKQNMTFSIFYKYTGKLPSYLINAQNELTKTIMQDYHTADCSISRAFWSRKLVVSLGAKNLFNVTNISGVSTGSAHSSAGNSIAVGMGRTYFMKLDINLNSK